MMTEPCACKIETEVVHGMPLDVLRPCDSHREAYAQEARQARRAFADQLQDAVDQAKPRSKRKKD